MIGWAINPFLLGRTRRYRTEESCPEGHPRRRLISEAERPIMVEARSDLLADVSRVPLCHPHILVPRLECGMVREQKKSIRFHCSPDDLRTVRRQRVGGMK